MWCCKRLDASDWPVTTIVRGNVSCLHVVPLPPLLRSGMPAEVVLEVSSYFSLSLSFRHERFFSFLQPFRSFAASLPHRERLNGKKEREFAYLCKRTEEDEGRIVSTRNEPPGRRPCSNFGEMSDCDCDERQHSCRSIFFLGWPSFTNLS